MNSEKKTKSKYKNKKIVVDGIEFDSKDESIYYLLLKQQKENGLIKDFEIQPKYELVPKFEYQGKKRQAITYTPDFNIIHFDDSITAVDVKSIGTATQQGELRRKLFEYRFPNVKLIWVCRNLTHGDKDGWLLYEELKKIYSENKKKKKEAEEQ